jgi:hypothetical protein
VQWDTFHCTLCECNETYSGWACPGPLENSCIYGDIRRSTCAFCSSTRGGGFKNFEPGAPWYNVTPLLWSGMPLHNQRTGILWERDWSCADFKFTCTIAWKQTYVSRNVYVYKRCCCKRLNYFHSTVIIVINKCN